MQLETIANQNDKTRKQSPNRDQSPVIALYTGPNNAVGAIVVIKAEFVTGDPITLQLYDALNNAIAGGLTGPNQYGYANAPGAVNFYAQRTDATGGTCEAAIGQSI